MNKAQFIAAVAEILEIPSQGLEGPEELEKIGNWDSLSYISFVAMVDTDFGKVVDPEKLRASKTLNDLAALVGL